MKKIVFGLMMISCVANYADGQRRKRWEAFDPATVYSIDSTVKGGIKLVFVSNDPTFDPAEKKKMIETFYAVYPKECKIYNPKSTKKVTIFIDTAYTAVAATGGGLMRVNPQWMKKNPEDLDVVTHEAMHVVQGYPRYEPIWVTEGIADYVRATLGVNNEAAKWTLPAYKSSQSYTNSYRITARFFIWLDKNVKKGLIVKLDNAMRANTYSDDFWKNETGKTVDQLWEAYGQNPTI
ncbi:MAG: secretory protein [Pseudopedobacter saltans]|uniref:Secretory protein n=1 Tax=Pseudopedobacter saltans TaxID=151895 RepID=A0A2W5FBV1_9SPHI|nr:MAG: secretory protein [Pseudopedobacter saltans]